MRRKTSVWVDGVCYVMEYVLVNGRQIIVSLEEETVDENWEKWQIEQMERKVQ